VRAWCVCLPTTEKYMIYGRVAGRRAGQAAQGGLAGGSGVTGLPVMSQIVARGTWVARPRPGPRH
jgi:hypothetical protein